MPARRVLLVGWDAADWKVIRPLIEKGHMPNLARLIKYGVHGNLATIYPVFSPMLWTSIATGKRPTKHGIHGFLEPTPDGKNVRPVTNLSRRVKAVWNILNQSGKRSVVVGWWPSHPAEPINGIMVSDQFHKGLAMPPPPRLPAQTVHPPEWAPRLADLRVLPVELEGEILRLFVPAMEKVDQAKDKTLHGLARTIAETMSVHAAATEALAETPWDFAAIYYDAIDHFSHGFMRYHPPRPRWVPEREFDLYKDVIANAYRYHDAMLGRLLELAGPDAHVLVISDHGFHPDHHRLEYIPAEAAGAALEHRHFGIFCLSGSGVRRDETVFGGTLLDITPTLLHLFGLPIGEDMDGKVLLNAFAAPAPVDSIPTWEDVPGDAGTHPADAQLDPIASAEALKQLVALGYVAPPSEDAQKNVEEAVGELRLNLALAHMDAQRHDLAELILTALYQVDSRDPRPVERLVECLLHRRAFDECRRLLDDFDKICRVAAPRAKEELERRMTERPIEELDTQANWNDKRELRDRKLLSERATGYELKRSFWRLQLALAHGDRQEALAWLLPIEELARAKGSAAVALRAAQLAFQAGDEERALHWCQTAVAADGENWQAWTVLARIHHEAGRFDEAFDAAVESLGLIYHQPVLHYIVGRCLLARRDFEEAEKALRVAVAQLPGLLIAQETLAELYEALPGRAAEALALRARIRALKESHQAAGPPAAPPPTHSPSPAPPSFSERWTEPDPERDVVVVSGLPRSGTSMMMQVLAAGGVAVWTDAQRQPDEDNPKGYFELAQATRLAEDSAWLAQARSRAVKIVAPLLSHLPRGQRYRVILMQRDLSAVIASQRAMLSRQGRLGADLNDEALKTAYVRLLRGVKHWLERREDVAVLPLDYDEVLAMPAQAGDRIARFLGRPFDVTRAAAAIDPRLRRQAQRQA